MSSALLQTQVYLRHRGLLFWSFFVPGFFLIPLTVLSHVRDVGAASMTLFTLLGLAMSLAFFLSSAQQELLSKALCFMMPGLREGMWRNQAAAGVGAAITGLAAAFLIPGLAAVVQGDLAQGLSVACLMLLAFHLTLLVVFQFNYSAWIPFQVIWMLSLGMKFLFKITPEQIGSLLDQSVLLAFAAGLSGFLITQQMHSRALHRKLAQRPYISIADVKNKDRLEEFKRARNRHKPQRKDGPRPLAGVLQGILRRFAASRQGGHHSRAQVWEALFLTLATSVPRSRIRLGLILGIFPVGLALAGYYDSRAILAGKTDMQGWFTGLLFMVSASGSFLAYHLRVRTAGRLFSRQDILKAGWLGTGLMLSWGLALTAFLFGTGHLLNGVLPQLVIRGETFFMVTPPVHLWGAVLFILPLQLLVFTLWRRPGSPMVLQQTGTLAFFIYHGAFSLLGTDQILVPLIGLTAALWLVLPLAWRRRVTQGDQV